METSTIKFRPATAKHADSTALLIYQSVHALMDFMFQSSEQALPILNNLLARSSGQFSYRYLSVMQDADQVVGVVLGYSREQFLQAELPGAINMLKATPLKFWPHLMFTVNGALSGYVPPPSPGAFYINNIAVDANARGQGYGS